jgi:hypothetical protein
MEQQFEYRNLGEPWERLKDKTIIGTMDCFIATPKEHEYCGKHPEQFEHTRTRTAAPGKDRRVRGFQRLVELPPKD